MSEFLDHDYKVNLLLATKQELNYDNTSISRMAHGIIGEDGKLTLKDYNDFMIRRSLLPTSLKHILTMLFPTLYISRGIPLKK